MVAVARRFAEAVEGLLYPIEIGFAGSHSLEGIAVRWLLADGLAGTAPTAYPLWVNPRLAIRNSPVDGCANLPGDGRGEERPRLNRHGSATLTYGDRAGAQTFAF